MEPPYVSTGKTSLRADVFDGLLPSECFELHSARIRRPARDDYADRLMSRGLLAEPRELVARPALVAEVQAHWHSLSASTCLFAGYLSGNREEKGWWTIVPAEEQTPVSHAAALASAVRKHIEDPGAGILSLVVPSIDSIEGLVEFVRALSQEPDWYVVSAGHDHDRELGRLVCVGVRVRVGGGQTAPVLGFGPFAPFARTRLAPFVELVFRAKPAATNRSSRWALPSDVDLGELSRTLQAGWADRTSELRSVLLQDDQDRRGTSRVTFVVPEESWRSLADGGSG